MECGWQLLEDDELVRLAALVARAWTDADFHRHYRERPRQALEEYGIDYPHPEPPPLPPAPRPGLAPSALHALAVVTTTRAGLIMAG